MTPVDESPAEQRDLLNALADLRADAAPHVLPLLHAPRYPHLDLAVDVLAWSKDPRVGGCLRDWAVRNVRVRPVTGNN